MATLAEISKATKEEKQRNKTQARIGLASNVLGIGAGSAGLYAAAKDPALRRKVGSTVIAEPRKISRRTKVLAGGALALQAANLGGDMISNRVLARQAQVKKQHESITDIHVSKAAQGTGRGNMLTDEDYDKELASARENVRPRLKNQYTSVGAGYGGSLLGMGMGLGLRGSKMKAGRRAAAIGAGTVGGAAVGGALFRHAAGKGYDRFERKAKSNPEMRRRVETAVVRRQIREKMAAQSVNKAYRRYDPEADRQRRLGLYAGLGALGAGMAGHEAARTLTTDVSRDGQKLRGLAFKHKKGKQGALLSAAALGSGALGAGAYRKGISERNNPWN